MLKLIEEQEKQRAEKKR